MNSLPPLEIPRKLIFRKRAEKEERDTVKGDEEEEGGERGVESVNQTDQEKSVAKRTAALIKVNHCNRPPTGSHPPSTVAV